MPKLSDILSETQSADVEIGGSKVKIVYHVFWESRFTDDDWKHLKTVTGREYFMEVLPRMLTEWDLTDDDNHSVPVTREAIEQHDVPLRFLSECERVVLAGVLTP